MNSRRSLLTCSSGVAMLEFAGALVLLMTMLLGTLELSRYVLLQQKLDKVANSMADFVTQNDTVTADALAVYAQAVPEIMQPFPFDGSVVFSSVAFFNHPLPPCEGDNVACITWQNKQLGGDSSKIGACGGNAGRLPGGYIVAPGQNIIVTEVFMNYRPLLEATGIFISGLAPQKLYRVAIYKPRQGVLTTLGGGSCG